MSSNRSDSSKIKDYDASITALKNKISQSESKLLISSKKPQSVYSTPLKPNTDRTDPSTVEQLTNEK